MIDGGYWMRRPGLGVEHFGQAGSIAELYAHFGIDAQGIIRAANGISSGRPIRYLRRAAG